MSNLKGKMGNRESAGAVTEALGTMPVRNSRCPFSPVSKRTAIMVVQHK